MGCRHANLYPSMDLQIKMGRCGHFLLHGDWECQDCGEWIKIECENEWNGREGVKSKDGKYIYLRKGNKNHVLRTDTVVKAIKAKIHELEQKQALNIV